MKCPLITWNKWLKFREEIVSKRCGNTHGYQKGECPAWGTICSACGKKNHWAKMCINKNENKRRFAQACTTHNPKQPYEIQNKKRNNRICAINSDTREPSKLYREFKQLTFDAVQEQRDNRTEISTELQIRLPDRPGTHTLKAKVDTGAEGNTLPLRTSRQGRWPRTADSRFYKKKELSILTAYNGSSIMQHGSVCIQCAHKGKWTTLKFFIVTTEGPTIIGLPSLRNLELISLYSTIKEDRSN